MLSAVWDLKDFLNMVHFYVEYDILLATYLHTVIYENPPSNSASGTVDIQVTVTNQINHFKRPISCQ